MIRPLPGTQQHKLAAPDQLRLNFCESRDGGKHEVSPIFSGARTERGPGSDGGRFRRQQVLEFQLRRPAQAIVAQRFDRREIAMVLVVGPLEGRLSIGNGIDDQREDTAVPWR